MIRPAFVLSIAALLLAGGHVHTQSGFTALPRTVVDPPDNPSTPQKVALGRLLFWDPILAAGQDIACATCHRPDAGYSDGLQISQGVHTAKRNSLTLLNAGFIGLTDAGGFNPGAAPMFWDVRAQGLEGQALEPIKTVEEMRGDNILPGGPVAGVVARLAANPEYRQLFAEAFGGAKPVGSENLAKAIAAFERSLIAANSPFDRFMRGDRTVMTPDQLRGMVSFEQSGCLNCHNGPMFSDFKPHVLGVVDNPESTPDLGTHATKAFRTPSLRNLAMTAPYMHGGMFPTIDSVLSFYTRLSAGLSDPRSNRSVARDQLDPLVAKLNVRTGRFWIPAFLDALNDDTFDRMVPDRVPSGLRPGGKAR